MNAPLAIGYSNKSTFMDANWHHKPASLSRMPATVDDFLELILSQPNQPFRQGPLHRDLQRFLDSHKRALIELPRDHGKSTQVCGRVLWELGRDPDLRVVLVCGSDRIAAERCGFIRRQIAFNPRVRMVFPHLRPGRPWGDQAFQIAGQRSQIGPSLSAIGVGAVSTGVRADLLICDDIVDVKSLLSAPERRRTDSYFRENLMNLLEPTGRLWNLFTPWHRDDLNAKLKQNPAFAHFRRAIDDDLNPLWPEHWPTERLTQRRDEIGSVAFSRAYHLKPLVEEDSLILSQWISHWNDESAYAQIVLAIDPAVSTKPNADASALVVLGLRETGEIDCLETVARRVRPPELLETIRALEAFWKPSQILFEQNGAFQAIFDMVQREGQLSGRLIGVTQSASKLSRVQVFSVAVEKGRFRLKGDEGIVDPTQRSFFDEMIAFPHGDHDDLLDAAALGTQFLMMKTEPRVWL